MRTITRAVQGGACSILVGALVAGIGLASAQAAPAAPSGGAVSVRLKVGAAAPVTVTTPAVRPRQLVARAGVHLDGSDELLLLRHGHRVRAATHPRLRQGDLVAVTVVSYLTTTRQESVKRPTKVKHVSSLAPGKRKVVRQGRNGVRNVTVRITQRNGHRVHTRVTKRTVIKPTAKLVLVGEPTVRTVPGTGGLNWRALARCESGGRVGAVNSAGYYGLYQFSVGTWHSVGGSGMPNHASVAEQTYRAQKLYASRGRSPWPYCGRFL